MKLSDLKLTPAGSAATKKLLRQIHKATVAAAMEPKLRLGVVGIEIGQEQSTGLTSRVDESTGSPGETLKKIWNLLELKRTRNADDYDFDEALEDTAQVLAMYVIDPVKAAQVLVALGSLSTDLTNSTFSDVNYSFAAIHNSTVKLQPWFIAGSEAYQTFAYKIPTIRGHAAAVSELTAVFRHIIRCIKINAKTDWSPNYRIVEIAFKKIGAM